MALFDFRCLKCGTEYQEMVAYDKRDEVSCPSCGSKEKEQVFKANVKGPVCCGAASGFS
jgi:putative FmdB family regulatory protein